MVLDYSERRQVSKNRSKKQPVKLITLFIVVVVMGIYSLGVASGWFLHKTLKKDPVSAAVPVAAEVKQKKSDTLPSPGPQQNQTAANAKSNEPSLTFYKTLPKGDMVALGSGLNPSRESKPANTVAAPQQTVNAKQSHALVEQSEKKAAREKVGASSAQTSDVNKSGDLNGKKIEAGSPSPEKTAAVSKEEKAKRKFTVQVASCNTKKEAEEIKDSLDRRGLPSYVVETKVPGKGTRYRVRLGNRLDLETANKIAGKAGRGAIVIPE